MCVCQELRTVIIHIGSESIPISHAGRDAVMHAWMHSAVVEWRSRSVFNVCGVVTSIFIILVQDTTEKRLKVFISIMEVVWCVLEECSQMIKRYCDISV